MIFELFGPFSLVGQMDLAPGQTDHYIRYISVIQGGPLPVTAELIKMAQYPADQRLIWDILWSC